MIRFPLSIFNSKYIAVDPEYDASTKKRDIALLHIEKEVEYNYYTLPICLDRPKAIPFFKYDDCVVTGWGKSGNTFEAFHSRKQNTYL